ncbi:serine--tRNA ligase [bacterium endosymbiont of Pedicinus badii]|uniref:serine--tRNA ligase n=1 Tax=bacterium endosymbiont of Pedicinus badii TaxID=1719126 RepID=UPI0009BA15CE|nr:serine--tRNA ligase [bacterium endosymbiont of Pedicinus badii]OQM34343.1 seryl-tRNA synthetase [bacterium endosymbiont of Pedicinus badii]
MLNKNLLKTKFYEIKKQLLKRNFFLDEKIVILEEEKRKKLQIELEKLQKEKNKISKKIGISKNKVAIVELYFKRIKKINQCIQEKKNLLKEKKKILKDYLEKIPNILSKEVPYGTDYKNNVEIKKFGNPKRNKFFIQDHVKIGIEKKGIDFVSSAEISGSKFVILKNQIARMHRSLIQFMLDFHTEINYQEIYVPYIVKYDALYGSGQLPKFSKNLFAINIKEKENQFLIPTAEVPLINLAKNRIFEVQELPKKFVAHSPCFRYEGKSYGKKNQGMIRLNQFDKVELVQIVHPKKSKQALEEITLDAEKILQNLELPYRKVLLCSQEICFSSCKTYDLEVWIPSENRYIEVSSCSNTSDFQSRRINAKFIDFDGKKKFVHILNASGLAIGRTLVAIMENFQKRNGRIKIPRVLRKYMRNSKYIE